MEAPAVLYPGSHRSSLPQPPQPAPERRGWGGRSGPAVSPMEARRTSRGPHRACAMGWARWAETQTRSCAQRSLRRDAAELEGSDAHPRHIECRRPDAAAHRAVTQQQRRAGSARRHKRPSGNALSKPAGRRGGVRADLWASRRRALRTDRACHAATRGAASSGASQKSASARTTDPRVPFRREPRRRVSDPHSDGPGRRRRLGDAPAA